MHKKRLKHSRYIGALSLIHLSVHFAYAAEPVANALPQGGVVTQGVVAIQHSANVMNIQQSTPKAVVNWQSFDIGSASTVNVLQPNSSSVLLSRVVGNNPSQILGALNANGEVILINPNGILFGRDGSVNATGFTASTLDIKDSDFMSGNYRFFKTGVDGEIVNRGAINTRGYVALLGAKVTNDGLISTQGGNAYLGAAETIALPLTNSGRVRMELTAASVNASIENTQQGAIVTQGGQVFVQASTMNDALASVMQSGLIDTKGQQGGNVTVLSDGNIRVNGMIDSSSMDASLKSGDIVIGRDVETGALAKVANVSGATLISQNGFVETSGHLLRVDGLNVLAKDWLLDPYNITINGSASGTAYSDPNSGGSYTYTPSATSTILATDIQNSLNNGTNVIISTGLSGSAGSDAGNITVASNITKSSGGAATLTLEANNNITINSGVSITDSGMTTRNLGLQLTANGASKNGSSIAMQSNSSVDVGGAVNINVQGGTSGALNAAMFMYAGSQTNTNPTGTLTTLRGSSVNIQSAVSGSNVAGMFAKNGILIESTSGDVSIQTTHTGASTTGSGLTIGSDWSSLGPSGGNPTGPLLKSAGKLSIKTTTTGTAADGSMTFSDVRLQAVGDITVQAQSQLASSKAIEFAKTFGTNAANIRSTSGDVFIQSNQGSISMTGLVAANAIQGRNITIDNTGGTISTPDANGLVTLTKGGGTSTSATLAGVHLLNYTAGTAIVATGNLNITGDSQSTANTAGINQGISVSGKNVNLNGSSVNGNGIYTPAAASTTSGTGGDVIITGQSTGTGASSSALSLSGSITAGRNVAISGANTASSNTVVSTFINNVVTATAGTIDVTNTNNGTGRGVQLDTSSKLVTTNNAIIVTTDSLFNNPIGINAGTGSVTIQNKTAGVAVDLGATTDTQGVLSISAAELGKITAGKTVIGSSTAGNFTVSQAITSADAVGDLALIAGGNLAINATLQTGTTGTKNLTINGAGATSAISQTAAIKTNNLELLGSNASYTLNNTANNTVTLAANAKSVAYTDTNALTIGSVNSTTGITASGTVSIDTQNGNLNIAQAVAASGNVNIQASTITGTALTIARNVTSASGDIALTATTADTGANNAAVTSTANAAVQGKNVTLNATATGTSGKTLGYYGGGGSFTATNGNLNLTATSANTGDGFYMYGGALNATSGSINIVGQSAQYQGIGFDAAGINSPVIIHAGNGIVMTGTADATGQNAIHLNGVTASNTGGVFTLTATKGSILSNSTSALNQSGSGHLTLTTVDSGNITVPKIINSGTGNVIVAAGSNLAAGDATGGQLLTLSGNSIASGKTYLYTGSTSATGLLTNLDSSFSTLSLSGAGQNADSGVAYNSTINGGANAQVMFREKITLNLSGNNSLAGATLSKVYGEAGTLNSSATALLGDMRSQLKQNNLGDINTTVNGIAVTVSKAAVIDDLTGTLQNAQYSTSGYLQANTYSYGTLSGTKYTTSLTAGQAQVAVSQLALTGSISKGETIYGNTLTAGTVAFTNKVGTDVLTPTVFIDTASRVSTGGYLKVGDYTAIQSITALSGNDAGNYTFANVKGDYKVNALVLTGVTIASANTVYGSTLTAGSVSFSGSNLKSGDIVGATASVVSNASDLSASNTLKVGTYNQTVTQINSGNANNDASNYTFAPVTASSSYTVTQKELTLTPSSVAKEYDGSNSLVGVSLTPAGVVGIDAVNAIAGSGSFNDINAASSVSFTLGGLSLTGSDAANYKLTVSVVQNGLSGTGTILPKLLTMLGGSAADKNFDGNTSVIFTPGVLSGLVGNETLSLSSSAIFANSAAGTNKDVLVTYNIADGSGRASNYKFEGANPRQLDTVLHASIKTNKPFINPNNGGTQPSQLSNQGAASRVAKASSESVTVKSLEMPKKPDALSMAQCVPTSLTGVSLCFLSSE